MKKTYFVWDGHHTFTVLMEQQLTRGKTFDKLIKMLKTQNYKLKPYQLNLIIPEKHEVRFLQIDLSEDFYKATGTARVYNGKVYVNAPLSKNDTLKSYMVFVGDICLVATVEKNDDYNIMEEQLYDQLKNNLLKEMEPENFFELEEPKVENGLTVLEIEFSGEKFKNEIDLAKKI